MNLLTIPFLCIAGLTLAQEYKWITNTTAEIKRIASVPSDSIRKIELDEFWNSLVRQSTIPVTDHDSVLFLYRGNANQIVWRGDFNNWGYKTTNPLTGTRIPGTDLWVARASFPTDARLDYKILINDSEWILDPVNPHVQWSGVGGGSPNSELRMPGWKPDPVTQPHPGTPAGTLDRDILFTSKILGYQITYSIYYPHNYSPSEQYGIVYFTDGYEYLHEKMGNLPVILDNLIHQKKIRPLIAVLVDHREPVNRSNNRRMQELAMNTKYMSFFTDELVPQVESKLRLSPGKNMRAIIGTSMGGLTAAYFAFARPDIFGMAGIQSPAFWFKPDIYNFCREAANPPVKIFLTTGTINDAREGTQKMKEIFEKNTCTYQYIETSQGHSWGNWRDTIDEILIYFFSP
ncbi:MAG: alpha/beta hydrolase-fold protein [Cyclobacteriaceae bacterium]